VVSCSECGEEISVTEIPATGHSYATEFTIDTEATCEVAGSKSKHCANCDGKTEVTEIERLGHRYGAWVTVTEASCEYPGEEKETCSRTGCGKVNTREISPIGHSYREEYWEITPATCYSEGEEAQHCFNCGAQTNNRAIPKLEHNFGEWQTEREATCEGEGEKKRYCSEWNFCQIAETEIIAPLGHDLPEEYETSRPATCTEAGEEARTCLRYCGYTERKPIPAGHVTTEDSPTTCVNCGSSLTAIDTVNFPDEKLRDSIVAMDEANFNGDGLLDVQELGSITILDISGTLDADGGCSELTGIGLLHNLATLSCAYNSSITSLDLSDNFYLQNLDISGTGISSIDLSAQFMLNRLTMNDCTAFSSIDFSTCTNLTSVNMSGCTGLSGGVDFSNHSSLEWVDMAECSNVTQVSFWNDTALTYVRLSGCTSLTSLTLEGCSYLENLHCDYTALTSLDVSSCTSLNLITVSGTNLTELKTGGRHNTDSNGDGIMDLVITGLTDESIIID